MCSGSRMGKLRAIERINMSQLPDNLNTSEEIIDYLLDRGYNTVINDVFSSGMEYSLDDIESLGYNFVNLYRQAIYYHKITLIQ